MRPEDGFDPKRTEFISIFAEHFCERVNLVEGKPRIVTGFDVIDRRDRDVNELSNFCLRESETYTSPSQIVV